eukprot:CAMPEP_0117049392 /NCGR_PEP_ID=MMETSP0472-20121206/34105_1 /TAXON_ID=693140 ORGANISM="Tiarina fusus, Strain LIS" /NCGR_SAMPLE_ID=MMETSP0472 /ASSEMBLY_ACC=CAM_ASM_000603 /LENGTH=80 /DNA_ID=CAMNT_0004762781 /DNA_START=8 /DNA_END=247 /DNA_ORIENTATION=-
MVNYVFEGQYCFNVYNQPASEWNHHYKREFNLNGKTVTVEGMSFSGTCANNSFSKSVLNTGSTPSFGQNQKFGFGGTDLW